MKVLISGSTGMVGSTLYMDLWRQRHILTRLVRSVTRAAGNDLIWDGQSVPADVSRFEGFDVIVHLAGENVANGRWTEAKKKRIEASRIGPTENLSKILASLKNPPKTLLVASATGFYGNRGVETLEESSVAGTGFLPDVCKAWEAATKPAADKGIRVVNLRFGVILSLSGGALKKMFCPFKLGLGGRLGSGEQYMSWIVLDDVISAIGAAMQNSSLSGPVNVVAPNPVTNAEFTATMGNVLNRPTVLPMPASAARFVFGELADAMLLSSARVTPKKLSAAGYAFRQPKIEEALKSLFAG